MNLNSIYSPIEKELQKVDKRIKEELLTTTNKFLLKLNTHLLKNSGKKLRPALILLSLKASGKWNPQAIPVAAAIEILHTATLVHDDILDAAELRRGEIAINAGWGNEMALLLGDYLYFKAFSILSRINNKEILTVVSTTAQKICEGETTQTHKTFDVAMEEEEYLSIIAYKTASFMAACCQIGSILAQASPAVKNALISYGLNFGMAFQIFDDCLDFSNSSETTGKTVGRDIQQGKMTLPLIYLREVIEREQINVNVNRLFSQKEKTLSLFREYQIVESCANKINSFLNLAEQKISGIMSDSSPEKNSLLLMKKYLERKTQTLLLKNNVEVSMG